MKNVCIFRYTRVHFNSYEHSIVLSVHFVQHRFTCLITETVFRAERENEVPVGQWLNELRYRCEPECMTTLQSKSIATSEDMCRLSSIVCTDSDVVRDLYRRTKAVSEEFKQVYKCVLNYCVLFFYSLIYICILTIVSYSVI